MSAVAVLFVTSAVVAAPSPAQAVNYPKLVDYAYLFLTGCEIVKQNPRMRANISSTGDGCDVWFTGFSGSFTHFSHDAGGEGLLVMWTDFATGEMVATVAWHPYGEVLEVADTRNDGDTIYVQLREHDTFACWICAPNAPPGSSQTIDREYHNFEIAEDVRLDLYVWDDAGATMDIGNTNSGFMGGNICA